VIESVGGKGVHGNNKNKRLDNWDLIESAVSQLVPYMPTPIGAVQAFCMNRHYSILSALLCYSVSDSCEDRKAIIGRILELPRDCQHRLMKLIEHGKKFMSPLSGSPHSGAASPSKSRHRETPVIDRSRGRQQLFSSPSGFTPRRKKTSMGRASVEGLFSPATIDSSLEKMVKDLRKQNDALQSELKSAQDREMGLGQKMQDMEATFRKTTMKLESEVLRREEDTRVEYEAKLAEMQQELDDLRNEQELESQARQELASMQEDVELLEHTKAKLAETEAKLQKCRERLEELGDAKEALQREEEAHSKSVEECLRLSNELKALQPLKRQLEEYKTRAVHAEVKLAECQEDLKRLEQTSNTISSANKELLKGVQLQQKEAEELRRRLDDEQGAPRAVDGHAVADGLSELNPAIKEEMLRLRNENIHLKAFAAKREDDSVQRMEESLDDAKRLSEKFKEEFITTKGDLELTRQELTQSIKRESELKVQLEEQKSKLHNLEALAKEYSDQLTSTKAELETKLNKLSEAERREEDLQAKVISLENIIQDMGSASKKQLDELESTHIALEATSTSLHESQCLVDELKKEVDDWSQKAERAENEASILGAECKELRESLAQTESDLNTTRERESSLEQDTISLVSQIETLRAEVQEERRLREDEKQTAEDEKYDLRLTLEKKREKDLTEVQSSLTFVLESERESHRLQLEEAMQDYERLDIDAKEKYESLKTEMESAMQACTAGHEQQLAEIEAKYEKELKEIRSSAIEEQEKLLTKGKAMLKETKERAKEQIAALESELQGTNQLLDKIRDDFSSYQERSREKVATYKQKIHFAQGRIDEISGELDVAQDSLKTIEREKFKLQEENERFRRQLGGRFGADGKVQNQLEMLQKEFNAVLDENRQLKADVAKLGSDGGLGSFSSEGGGPSYRTRGGTRGSTLSQLRKEFEETIEALNDEKRELIMKNSAAITDVQKAEQRAWELEKDVARLKQEITSLNLALQRAERYAEDDMAEVQDELLTQEQSYHTCEEDAKENNVSASRTSKGTPSQLLIDCSAVAENPVFDPSPATAILSPSTKANTPSNHMTEETSKQHFLDSSHIRPEDVAMAAKRRSSTSGEKNIPSLAPLAQHGSAGQEGQAECKQS
jgi:chromosome segregation ATPase